jgi:hypothetical protein
MPLENSLSRYVHRAMDALPSSFAQLVFLASLRDPYTGHYIHEGWASVSSPVEVNQALRLTHQSIFESVVDLPLLALCKELRRHFESLGETELRAANLWLETEPYYELIPEKCPVVPRKFFISQLRLALEVLVRAPGWSCLGEPAALQSPPPGPEPQPQWLN